MFGYREIRANPSSRDDEIGWYDQWSTGHRADVGRSDRDRVSGENAWKRYELGTESSATTDFAYRSDDRRRYEHVDQGEERDYWDRAGRHRR